jgi:hypothetical protein
MNLLDVGDKIASILAFILALTIAIISLIRYIQRERGSDAVVQQSPTTIRLRRAVVVAASCVVLAFLVLAVLADPDFAFIAIYLTLAFLLGDLVGQTVQDWAYSPEIEDATTRRLRSVDRASIFAWIGLILLLEIGLTAISAQYASWGELFFQMLMAAGCILLTYYPYHFRLRNDYRNRLNDEDDIR